jgi:hypothetical protein
VLTRHIQDSDFSACSDIFNDAFNDLHRAYGFDEDVVEEDDSWLSKPLAHFLVTDPDGGLIVADEEGEVAFASSFLRDSYWFLPFLFVRPRAQGRGSDDRCSVSSSLIGTGSHRPRWSSRSNEPLRASTPAKG